MSDAPRYDEREVGLILRRVAELHEAEAALPDARSMTHAELEQVVDELGMSTSLVARAAGEVRRDALARPAWHLGGRTALLFEREVDGRVDDAALDRALEVVRREVGDPGDLRRQGGARIWSTTAASKRAVTLTIVEDGGRTTLRLEERLASEAMAVVGGTTAVSVVVGFFALALLIGPLALFVAAFLGWIGGREIWKRRAAGREHDMQRAFAEIVALAEADRPPTPDE